MLPASPPLATLPHFALPRLLTCLAPASPPAHSPCSTTCCCYCLYRHRTATCLSFHLCLTPAASTALPLRLALPYRCTLCCCTHWPASRTAPSLRTFLFTCICALPPRTSSRTCYTPSFLLHALAPPHTTARSCLPPPPHALIAAHPLPLRTAYLRCAPAAACCNSDAAERRGVKQISISLKTCAYTLRLAPVA